jgi:hypothetical protein
LWLSASVITTTMGSEPMRKPTPPMVPTNSPATGAPPAPLNAGTLALPGPMMPAPVAIW